MVHGQCIGSKTTTQALKMEYLPHKYNMDTIKRFGTLGIGIRALTKVQGQPLGPKRYF